MDTLKNKYYEHFDYLSRYAKVPIYYDTLQEREICGISGKLKTNISYTLHTLKQSDTLDSLALKYYNNPTFWWIIAYYNEISDPFIDLIANFSSLKIPALSSIDFEAN